MFWKLCGAAGRPSSPTSRASTRRLPSEVEDALWELTAGGTRHRRRLRESARAHRSQTAGAAREARTSVARGMRPDAGRSSPGLTTSTTRRDERASSPRASCCCAGACSSAICWHANRSHRPGAICCPCCADMKRAAKSAAAVSWRDLPASNLRGRSDRSAARRPARRNFPRQLDDRAGRSAESHRHHSARPARQHIAHSRVRLASDTRELAGASPTTGPTPFTLPALALSNFATMIEAAHPMRKQAILALIAGLLEAFSPGTSRRRSLRADSASRNKGSSRADLRICRPVQPYAWNTFSGTAP